MIKQVEIHNFKSIRNVSVELTPVSVLIGRSGVGKSNFLRAIRFLRNYLLFGENAAQIEGGWDRLLYFGDAADLTIVILFTISGYDDAFRYEVIWRRRQLQAHLVPAVEELRLGSEIVFRRHEKQWEVWPEAGKAPTPIDSLQLGSFPTISEAVLAFAFLTSGIGWHDFPAEVFRAQPQPSGPFGAPTTPQTSSGLNDAATNYLQILRDITQNLQSQHARRQILGRIRQINASVSSLELDSITQPKTIVVGRKLEDRPIRFDLSQESDGFRRYYAHLLALYQLPPKQVLMFEEPENGIYPGALDNLSEEFSNAYASGRGQILLTTQSPDLLDGFDPEAIRVVELDSSLSTIIAPLDAAQLQAVKDRLLEPGELMTIDRARPAASPA